MPAPNFQAIGTEVSSSGGITLAWPAHQTGDIGILVFRSEISNAPTVSGWTFVSDASGGFEVLSAACYVYIFYKKATSASESNVSISDQGDVNHGVILTVRGAPPDPVLSANFSGSYASLTGAPSSSADSINLVYNESIDAASVLVVFVAAVSKERGTFTSVDNLFEIAETSRLMGKIGISTGIASDPNDYDFNSPVVASYDYATNGDVLSDVCYLILLPSNPETQFSSSGSSTASFFGEPQFSSSGSSTASFVGTGILSSTFSLAGVGTAAFVGRLTMAVMSSSGVGTATLVGRATSLAVLSAAGTSILSFESEGGASSAASSSGTSTASFVGESSVLASFNSECLSQGTFYSPVNFTGNLSSIGTATATFYSANVTVATRNNGSTGVVNGEAIIDWTITDRATITLEPGDGVYQINHVNILWKLAPLRVAIISDGASGTLVWGGDATIDWGSAGAPDMPADGETLHLEFFAYTLTDIKGKLCFPKIVPRVQTVSNAATIIPNADTDDCVDMTAIDQAFTIVNPTGTPSNFQRLMIRIKDDSTPRAISWGSAYIAGGVALPSTTISGKILTLGFIYNLANSLNKWQLVAAAQET